MKGRSRWLVAAVLAILAVGAGAFALFSNDGASGAKLDEAEIAVVRSLPKQLRAQILLFGRDGGAEVAADTSLGDQGGIDPYDGVEFMPNGQSLLYTTFAGRESTRLAILPLPGGGGAVIPGTGGATHPVVSGDGALVAFSRHRERVPESGNPLDSLTHRYSSTSLWILERSTGKQRRLTPWTNALHVYPTSFDPSGNLIAGSRVDHGRRDAVSVNVANGQPIVLASNAADPSYSPNGDQIAFVGYSRVPGAPSSEGPGDIYVRQAEGGSPRRLTSGSSVETSPSWSPSGARLIFVRESDSGRAASRSSQLVEINSDGTCETVLLPSRQGVSSGGVVFVGPAWNPRVAEPKKPIRCDRPR